MRCQFLNGNAPCKRKAVYRIYRERRRFGRVCSVCLDKLRVHLSICTVKRIGARRGVPARETV